MKKKYMLLALVSVFAVGCQTQEQMVQGQQGMAVQTALNRARFDMNCQSATGQVLSTNVSQPAIQGTFRSATECSASNTRWVCVAAGSAGHTLWFVHKA